MRVKVKFTGVGRAKKCWTADIKVIDGLLDADDMIKSIKKRGALGSRDIEFGDNGAIIVGGFREVGRWEIVPEKMPAAFAEVAAGPTERPETWGQLTEEEIKEMVDDDRR